MSSTDGQRIVRTRPLLSPAILAEEYPRSDSATAFVADQRRSVEDVLSGNDTRLLVVVGPCSIHDIDAALRYGERLRTVADRLAERLQIVMRVYFEKPRTIVGWKGLINDPDRDGSYRINHGLRLARKLLVDLTEMGLPVGTEFLDTTFGQFYSDLVSWGAIGARTAESQIHRELASGLSMPVGIKNRTDGNVRVAIDAILSAGHSHLFPSLTKEGAPAIFQTAGNDHAHLILRGGRTGPNYTTEHVRDAAEQLRDSGVRDTIMVDCSHGNSNKDPMRQPVVAEDVIRQRRVSRSDDSATSCPIRGVMIESHLVGGRQDIDDQDLVFGKSITDACLSFEQTETLLDRLADG